MSRTGLGGFKLLVLLLIVVFSLGSCGPVGEPDVTSTLTIPTPTSTTPESTTAPSTTSTIPDATTTTTATATSTTPTTSTIPVSTTSAPQVEAAVVVTRIPTNERVVAPTFDAD